jgi:hypothetical protein
VSTKFSRVVWQLGCVSTSDHVVVCQPSRMFPLFNELILGWKFRINSLSN